MRMRARPMVLALVIGALALSGCTSADGVVGSSPSAEEATEFAEASWAVSYDSFDEVLRGADAIVVGVAGDQDVEWWDEGVPFTLTALESPEVLSGSIAGPVVVRQTGAAGDFEFAEDTPLLVPGDEYLLVLEEYVDGAGRETGEHLVRGWAAWRDGGDGTFRIYVRGLELLPVAGLPETTTPESLSGLDLTD